MRATLITLARTVVYVRLVLEGTSLALRVLVWMAGLSPTLRVFNVLIAASDARFRRLLGRYFPLPLLIALAGWLWYTDHEFYRSIRPPAGSDLGRRANFVAAVIFYSWLTIGAVHTGGYAIIASGLGGNFGKRDMLCRLFGSVTAVLLGIVVVNLPGPYNVLGMSAALLMVLLSLHFTLAQIASHRRALAPRAINQVTTAKPHAPLILFISDVHATAGRRRRTDGGQDGSPSLLSITKSYSSENRPSLLVVNGDLIDRGNVEEWATIAPALQRFREYGTRVIIAPGNHDIATAYESSAAAHLRRSPFGYVRSVESKKVIEFLKQAAIFEPELRCDDGRLLSTAVSADAKAIADFENEWKATLEEARTIVQSVAGIIGRAIERSGPRIVFRMLAKATPEEHIRLIEPLVAKAEALLIPPELPNQEAARTGVRLAIVEADECVLPEWLMWGIRMKFWYLPFPLHLVIHEESLEILIVNSTFPEPGLLGSAFGRLGAEQLQRLQSAVASSKMETIVIVMHHPVCGWSGNVGDDPTRLRVSVDRWALLVHDTDESRALTAALASAAPAFCRQIFLCGGHRHADPVAGPLVEDEARSEARAATVSILESGALADQYGVSSANAGRGVVILDRNERGALEPFLMPVA